MISEKNGEKFYIEQKMEFEKFNCFFINFLVCSFGQKVISTVVEREYTTDISN